MGFVSQSLATKFLCRAETHSVSRRAVSAGVGTAVSRKVTASSHHATKRGTSRMECTHH